MVICEAGMGFSVEEELDQEGFRELEPSRASLFPCPWRFARKPTTPLVRLDRSKGLGTLRKPSNPLEPCTLVGAGDIASCQHLQSAQATARLIEQIPGTVFAAGDLAYEKASLPSV